MYHPHVIPYVIRIFILTPARMFELEIRDVFVRPSDDVSANDVISAVASAYPLASARSATLTHKLPTLNPLETVRLSIVAGFLGFPKSDARDVGLQ